MRTDTGDTGHTHRGTSTGALQSYVSSYTQERTLGPRHTHGSYGRNRRQGGKKTSPEPHRFPWTLVWDSHWVWVSCCWS